MNRLDCVEKKISEFENVTVEISKMKDREKRLKNNTASFSFSMSSETIVRS